MTDDGRGQSRGHTTIVLLHMKAAMPGSEVTSKMDTTPISLESRVKDMIDCIESGHPSSREWIALNKFFGTLQGRKDSRSKRLLAMIEPIMAKYGQHGVAIKNTSVGDDT